MLKTVSRPPISRINAMVLASFAVGAVVAALLGGRMATVALLIGSAVGLAGALNARRPNARATSRASMPWSIGMSVIGSWRSKGSPWWVQPP
jgi:hypothetical protein